MSFQQGLSGLNASSKALNVIGNNVANSSTVGFKSGNVVFADVYAASLATGSANQVGIGATVATIAQQFTQGDITTTSNSLDVAIKGNGFFELSNGGVISYSRDGQFSIDNGGYLVNSSGLKLQGYGVDTLGNIVASTPGDLQVSASDLQPNATTTAAIGVNLNSTKAIPDTSSHPFSTSDSSSYNWSTSETVYDSLGNSHSVTMYFVKADVSSGTVPSYATGATGRWDVYMSVDGTATDLVTQDGGTAGAANSLYFDSSGAIMSPTTPETVSIDLAGVATELGDTNAATTPLEFTMNFADTTQYGSAFSVAKLSQDGYTSGQLSSLSIGNDGVIAGNYTNGQTRNMGQIVLASFTNPNGLESIGGNQWIQTAESGQPLVGTPESGVNGSLKSSALESSNVDLTSSLVDMITVQRAYQANAQTIKTEDTILQTLINLR